MGPLLCLRQQAMSPHTACSWTSFLSICSPSLWLTSAAVSSHDYQNSVSFLVRGFFRQFHVTQADHNNPLKADFSKFHSLSFGLDSWSKKVGEKWGQKNNSRWEGSKGKRRVFPTCVSSSSPEPPSP